MRLWNKKRLVSCILSIERLTAVKRSYMSNSALAPVTCPQQQPEGTLRPPVNQAPTIPCLTRPFFGFSLGELMSAPSRSPRP